MPLWFCAPVVAALLQAPGAVPPDALHVVVRSEFRYLGSTRTTESEFWASGDKLWRKRDGKVAEVPKRPDPTSVAPLATEDIHRAGFDYEPEFVWRVAESTETRAIHGRECHLTTAAGTAAYSQTELRLWFCPARGEGEAKVGELVANAAGGQFQAIGAFLKGEIQRRTGHVLLAVADTTEPAIAPVMDRRTEAVTLDTAPANQ